MILYVWPPVLAQVEVIHLLANHDLIMIDYGCGPPPGPLERPSISGPATQLNKRFRLEEEYCTPQTIQDFQICARSVGGDIF